MFVESDIPDVLLRAILLSAVALCWVIFVVRVVGLRAFSKMTAFDFVVTVAIGSLLAGASQASDWAGFFQASLAISALLGVQYTLAKLRKHSDLVGRLLENVPVLLMREGEMIPDAMRRTRVSEGDLFAKLREANVTDLSQVRAVVLEATGDISVLHGQALNSRLIEDVSGTREV